MFTPELIPLKYYPDTFDDLPGYDLLEAIIRKNYTEAPAPLAGTSKIGFYGLQGDKVRGIVQLTYNGRVIKHSRFYSRAQRVKIMLKWRMHYKLFEDGIKKSRFGFNIRVFH